MNSKSKLTLNKIKQSPQCGRQARASDFLTQADKQKLQQVNARGKRGRRPFDDVDAYAAEMIARFGYEFYERWNRGEIPQGKVDRLMAAERARERSQWLPLEGLLQALIQGGVPTYRTKRPPKIRKMISKIIKGEIKAARGEE